MVLILITAPNQISSGPDQALGKGGRVGAEHSISDFLEIKALERSESLKIAPQVRPRRYQNRRFAAQVSLVSACVGGGWFAWWRFWTCLFVFL